MPVTTMLRHMFGDRNEPREERIRPAMTATIALLAANIVVFIFQQLAERQHSNFPVDDYFALSLDGLKRGYVWQLLTFQFMHGGLLHIFFNSWAIFVFGRVVETTLGMRRMLTLYFLSGIVGGLVQVLGMWILPGLFGDAPMVGASAGASGLMAAFAVLYPDQILYLLLAMVIPIKLRATTLLWVLVVTSVVGIVIPYGNIAHAAHLGGVAAGFLYARNFLRHYRRVSVPPIITASDKAPLNITTTTEKF